MSFDPIVYLREGNVNFIWDISLNDRESLAKRVRCLPDRTDVVKVFLPDLIDTFPEFCFTIIYDMEEYMDDAIRLMNKHSFLKLGNTEIKNILYNTNYGEEYIYDKLESILSEDDKNRMSIIIEFVYNASKNKEKWITKLSRNENLHIRALFILYMIKRYPEYLSEIYDELPKYMTSYTGLPGEQLTFLPNKVSVSDMSEIVYACLELPLDRKVYLQLKEYLLENYEENDLAKLMLSPKRIKLTDVSATYSNNKKGIEEFKLDADRLFVTSRNYQYQILQRYSENVTKELIDKFTHYLNYFQSCDDSISPIYKIIEQGLFKELKMYVDKYLDMSKDKSTEPIGNGSTCHCFRLGDYVIKLVKTKWSYETIICPSSVFRIVKNEEEHFVRDAEGIVIAGLEVEKYLRRSAKGLPHKYFEQLLNDLKKSGYYTTDTLMGGKGGDNCRILDSYKDADCFNPESLPDYFKKLPLVLVDRDRVYSLKNQYPKQLRESCY